MNLQVVQGAVQSFAADALIVNLFTGVTAPGGATGALDQALGGAISELIAQGDLKGKSGEVAVLYPRGAVPATRVLIAGLGERHQFDLEAVRRASAEAVKKAQALGARHLATIVHGAGIGGLPIEAAAQATVEGALLALYRFDAPKQGDKPTPVETLSLVEFDGDKLAQIEAGARRAEAVARGVYLARDLVNLPPNVATPTKLAEVAQQLAADYGLGLTIGDRAWAAAEQMGAFLAVAKGAGEEPKFIVLEHNPHGGSEPPLVIVGKGITFDTGGISLKDSEGMAEMTSDMAGAAAVLGTIKALGELKLPARVVALAPCTENMPDAHAYRPADVIRAKNGKTVEIISTDAEGRLILADALVYAQRYTPKAVIDLATLTGSCVVALGEGIAAGLFSNDEALQAQLLAAGQRSHERLWPLPLWPEYRKVIDSEVADMKNSGGRYGGVATSAVFLQEFAAYPWAHLDIAGMALASKASAYTPVGGTGFGVRLLSELAHGLSRSESL
ncbi:MAG: leucyl aminopeptidase [Truepera sp.]|nr:leucyl aminopeptidase [Truepera sp.]